MEMITLNAMIIKAWGISVSILNSAFMSAFLSSLAGAGLGVLGAQRVSERAARRKELRDALNQSNALVALSTTIVNQSLSTKKQHISPLSKTFFLDRKEAEENNEIIISGGQTTGHIHFRAEMVHITPLTVPIEALKSLTFASQLIPGRALALAAMIEQSLTELSHAVNMRATQIELLRGKEMSPDVFMQTYFGLRRADGSIDSMYHDTMVAISQYTDDVAFFSSEFAEELQLHGTRVRDKLLLITKDVGKVSNVDFSEARNSGILPPKANYESWLSGFRSQE